MLILEKIIPLDMARQKPTTFIIDRFTVPSDLIGLQIQLKSQNGNIACAFIYDADDVLRAELNALSAEKQIIIHEETLKTSGMAKPGPIPGGEWMIALEVNHREFEEKGQMSYTVVGIMKSDFD